MRPRASLVLTLLLGVLAVGTCLAAVRAELAGQAWTGSLPDARGPRVTFPQDRGGPDERTASPRASAPASAAPRVTAGPTGTAERRARSPRHRSGPVPPRPDRFVESLAEPEASPFPGERTPFAGESEVIESLESLEITEAGPEEPAPAGCDAEGSCVSVTLSSQAPPAPAPPADPEGEVLPSGTHGRSLTPGGAPPCCAGPDDG